jgi:hypothetical protein
VFNGVTVRLGKVTQAIRLNAVGHSGASPNEMVGISEQELTLERPKEGRIHFYCRNSLVNGEVPFELVLNQSPH